MHINGSRDLNLMNKVVRISPHVAKLYLFGIKCCQTFIYLFCYLCIYTSGKKKQCIFKIAV